ncbi:restriction endonuclease [Sphingobium sp. RSMS]|uniref:restriction endonuclease n=1 Tax=Sphingobium sp. RSMS TaxID=520734 RepID=UPI0010F6723D|nr:restriction endonuclease [Sphingobium sp. RSMS]UXC90758.1 restriction endonuclease [Sphingobium sp. RSMS]
MPDGYAFELKIAERMRGLGWTCEMTPGSGDFGADLFCRVGEEFIIIQCKCYEDAFSIGVGAVQEVCTAVRHFNAARGLVVYEGRPSKAAKSLAHSVGVLFFHADELIAGWEYDRTAEGMALRINQREEREAAEARERIQRRAQQAEEYKIDYEAYLDRLKDWEVGQAAWEKKSKSWSGGWAAGAAMIAGFGVLVLFSGGPSSDALLGLGLMAVGAAIFFARYPWAVPTKPVKPVPVEEAVPPQRAGTDDIFPSKVGILPKQREGDRVIVRCSRCQTQLRVPSSKRLRIGCPKCGLSEIRETPPGAMLEY